METLQYLKWRRRARALVTMEMFVSLLSASVLVVVGLGDFLLTIQHRDMRSTELPQLYAVMENPWTRPFLLIIWTLSCWKMGRVLNFLCVTQNMGNKDHEPILKYARGLKNVLALFAFLDYMAISGCILVGNPYGIAYLSVIFTYRLVIIYVISKFVSISETVADETNKPFVTAEEV